MLRILLFMYLFYLHHKDLPKPIRVHDPIGWDTTGKKIVRDKKWFGVFFEYTPKLKWIKDGRSFIQYYYEKYGVKAEIKCIVFKKNKSTRKYEQLYTGKLNLMSYSISTTYVECNIEQTGFVQDFKNKSDQKVNVYSSGSKTFTLHSKGIKRVSSSTAVSNLEVHDEGQISGADIPGTYYIISPNRAENGDEIEERQDYGANISELHPVEVGKYKWKLKEDGEYTFLIREDFRVSTGGGICNWDVQWYFVYGQGGVYTTIPFGSPKHANNFVVSSVSIYNDTLSLKKEDEIYVFGEVVTTDVSGFTATLSYQPIQGAAEEGEPPFLAFTNVEAITYFPATDAKGMMVFEAFNKIVANNTGKTNRFKSTFYGRIENGYAENGEGSLKGLFNGSAIRGFDPSVRGIYMTFDELIENCMRIDGVAAGIEVIEGKEYVVVEKLSYFYKKLRSIQIPWVRDIKKTVREDRYYSKISGGYTKGLNEQINNLDEFNAKREYIPPISVNKKTLDLRCSCIASGYTIEFVRRDHVTISETKDNNLDNDIFIIQMIDDEGTLRPQRTEGMGVGGVIDASTVYNANLSPMRNLRRNGSLIRSGLVKLELETIVQRGGEGNTDFISSKGSEATVSEKSVTVSQLDAPHTFPEDYEFEAPLSVDDQHLIEELRYNYIEFSRTDKDWKRGYVDEIEYDPASELLKFKLERANV